MLVCGNLCNHCGSMGMGTHSRDNKVGVEVNSCKIMFLGGTSYSLVETILR